MGSTYPHITDDQANWLKSQPVFFVATAPLSGDGHVNCSPKGGDCFRVLDPRTVAYLDYTGSGAETIAHLRENGRMVIMFCAFEGEPVIVRLHGRGEVIAPDHPDYAELAPLFPSNPGARSIIRMQVTRISDSCGMAVPLMSLERARSDLDEWATDMGPERLRAYRQKKNAASMDGLPAWSGE